MCLNKIDLPYCLVEFFVVCPRLRQFWRVFGETRENNKEYNTRTCSVLGRPVAISRQSHAKIRDYEQSIAKLAYDNWSPCRKYSTLDSFPSYLFLGICGRISLTFRVICRRLFVRVGGIDHGHQSHAQIHSEKIHHTKTRTGQSC